MTGALTRNEIDYLRSLVRMDIRKRERSLAKFEPKSGQPLAEAEAFREKLENNLAFRERLFTKLSESK